MERLDGETILIDFESGQFYSFRNSAADIASLIDLGLRRSAWNAVLRAAFVDCGDGPAFDEGIDAFVNALEEAGLIERIDVSEPLDATDCLPKDYERGVWHIPVIAVNDSLSDLLAIDPIHDVSDDGWPQTPSV